jgi:UDP-N-acetyl-D-mannosaminuronate dehydrogenase
MRSFREAEAVAVVEDSFRDVNLALTSELAILFDRIGIDITNVLKAVRTDSPDAAGFSGIGGARTSSAAYYLARSGHENEMEQQFLASARRIISYLPEYVVKLLAEALREEKIPLKGANIALLGISNDGDPEQEEESAGTRIRGALERKGAVVRVYDPCVAGAGRDIRETMRGAQAAIIAGNDPMFCSLTPRQFEEFGICVVVDARNCLDKDLFEKSPVRYRGIGRGA